VEGPNENGKFVPAPAHQNSRFPLSISLASKSGNESKWKRAVKLNGQVPTTSSVTRLGGRGKKERVREFEGLLEQAKSGMTLRIAADGTKSGVGSSATGKRCWRRRKPSNQW